MNYSLMRLGQSSTIPALSEQDKYILLYKFGRHFFSKKTYLRFKKMSSSRSLYTAKGASNYQRVPDEAAVTSIAQADYVQMKQAKASTDRFFKDDKIAVIPQGRLVFGANERLSSPESYPWPLITATGGSIPKSGFKDIDKFNEYFRANYTVLGVAKTGISFEISKMKTNIQEHVTVLSAGAFSYPAFQTTHAGQWLEPVWLKPSDYTSLRNEFLGEFPVLQLQPIVSPLSIQGFSMANENLFESFDTELIEKLKNFVVSVPRSSPLTDIFVSQNKQIVGPSAQAAYDLCAALVDINMACPAKLRIKCIQSAERGGMMKCMLYG